MPLFKLSRCVLGVSLLMLAGQAVAQSTDLISLYTSGRDSDPEYRAAIASAYAKAEAAPQGLAGLLPQISLNGFITHSDSHLIETSSTFPSNNGQTLIKGASLTLTQPLFNAQAWLAHKQGNESAAQAYLEAGIAEQSLIIRAAEAYFSFLSANAELKFAAAELSALQKDLERANSRYEIGMSAITDLHETQARHDIAFAQKISAEQDVLNALDIVAEILGETADSARDVPESIELLPAEGEIEQWVQEAVENNLQIQLARSAQTQAQFAVRSQKSGHLPTVNLSAEYAYSDSTEQVFGSRSTDARAQLSMNVPLFAGGATRSRVRQAQAQLDSANAEAERVEREVKRGVRSAFRGVSSSAQRARALKQASVSAETALEATQAGYDVGTRTTVDVLNAQREVFRAKRDFARARYDYVLQQLTLYRQHGSLGPQHVVAANAMLTGERL